MEVAGRIRVYVCDNRAPIFGLVVFAIEFSTSSRIEDDVNEVGALSLFCQVPHRPVFHVIGVFWGFFLSPPKTFSFRGKCTMKKEEGYDIIPMSCGVSLPYGLNAYTPVLKVTS